MSWLVMNVLKFIFGYVFLGEIAKAGMRVFGSIVVFPRFIGLISLFVNYSLELVLT